jgi:hypothetical protein
LDRVQDGRRGEPAAKHPDALLNSAASANRRASAGPHVLSESAYPIHGRRAGSRSLKSPPSFRETMGKVCRVRIFSDAPSHLPADVYQGSDQKDLNHATEKRLKNVRPDPVVHGRSVDPTTGPKERKQGRKTMNEGQTASWLSPGSRVPTKSASQLESLR